MNNEEMHNSLRECVRFSKIKWNTSLKHRIVNGKNVYYLCRFRANSGYIYYYKLLLCTTVRLLRVRNKDTYTSKIDPCFIIGMNDPVTNYHWRLNNGSFYNDSVGYMHRYVREPGRYQKIKFNDGNKLNLLFSNMELVDDAIKLKKRRPELIIKANY